MICLLVHLCWCSPWRLTLFSSIKFTIIIYLNQYFFVCFNCLLTDQITKIILVETLVHSSNKPVDLVFPVASISTFYKMGGLFLHSTSWRRQFKGSQEVVGFFEMFSNSIDLMSQILHADDSVISQEIEPSVCCLSGQVASC